MIRLSIALAALAFAVPAAAGQPVSLKSEAFAAGPVTLGDVFDGAGRAGALVVGPAAQPGANIILDAGQLQRQARAAGLDWDNAQGLRRIVVHGGAASEPALTAVAGKPGPMAQVLTYARNLNAGDIVRAEDLTWGEVAAFQAPSDAPRDAEAAIGKAAKKPVRAGAAVAGRDLTMPQVIKKDDVIQIAFRADGITLTLQAKAMEAATLGEPFSAQNLASKKVIEAVATGPGRAVVGPEAERIRAQTAPSLVSLR
jgi:flagella basal body P-ring formation protein FlgA